MALHSITILAVNRILKQNNTIKQQRRQQQEKTSSAYFPLMIATLILRIYFLLYLNFVIVNSMNATK